MSTAIDKRWFSEARFGLFIHWGVYALPARHEWVKKYETISDETYDQYLKYFDPDLFNPDEWAETAKAAGMKYVIITTKHHDGFCLWDSKLTNYKVTNTPAKRDLIKPVVEAFRKRGIKVGLYYSLIDWNHPDFVIDEMHPLNGHPQRAELNKSRNQQNYINYLHAQVRELLTEFGKIDLLFFDFSYPPGKRGRPDHFDGKGKKDWDSPKLLKMIRELQPHIVLNDRLDLEDGWDYKTPEQVQVREKVKVNGNPVVWEAIHTFSGSWGYHRDESNWKTVDQLVKMLIDTVSKDGNLNLNVGPTARGDFDNRALDRLQGIGEWLRRHGDSIYGCSSAPEEFKTPEDCRLTYNSLTKRLYVHVLSWPFKHLHLDGFAGKVEYAQLLNDDSELKMIEGFKSNRGGHTDPFQWGEDRQTLSLQLPVGKPDVEVPVIELFLITPKQGEKNETDDQ